MMYSDVFEKLTKCIFRVIIEVRMLMSVCRQHTDALLPTDVCLLLTTELIVYRWNLCWHPDVDMEDRPVLPLLLRTRAVHWLVHVGANVVLFRTKNDLLSSFFNHMSPQKGKVVAGCWGKPRVFKLH